MHMFWVQNIMSALYSLYTNRQHNFERNN